MNKDVIESQWIQIREILSEKFSNLTEEDIKQINGRYDELVVKLQQKYGYTREEAEDRIRSWNFDRFATPKDEIILEETETRRNNNSSFYKWLLGLGIPILLFGSYFLSNRTPEVTRSPTPAVTQEQLIVETPADRLISNGLRSALLQQQDMSFAIQNVKITTHDGVVTLSGSVPSTEMRNSVATTAQNFAGVKKVVNLIEVK